MVSLDQFDDFGTSSKKSYESGFTGSALYEQTDVYLFIWICLHKYTKCCCLYWTVLIIEHVQFYMRHNLSHLEYCTEQNNLNQYALVMQGWWIFISSPALFYIFSMSEWEDFHSKPLNTDHLSSLRGTSCLWFPFVSLTAHTHILMTNNSVNIMR